jgi:hypothetical protein
LAGITQLQHQNVLDFAGIALDYDRRDGGAIGPAVESPDERSDGTATGSGPWRSRRRNGVSLSALEFSYTLRAAAKIWRGDSFASPMFVPLTLLVDDFIG